MSIRVDSASLISGKTVVSLYAGHGIQAQNIPSTGTSGAGYLYNDIAAQGAAATDEMRGELLTLPSSGTLAVNEDSSFSFIGAPDGTYTFTYRGFRNGVSYGDYTVALSIGGTGYALPADGAAWSFAGGDATMAYSPASAAYVLNADGGQWSSAGGDATLLANRSMAALGGSWSYVGGPATLRYSGAATSHISGYTISYASAGVTATFN